MPCLIWGELSYFFANYFLNPFTVYNLLLNNYVDILMNSVHGMPVHCRTQTFQFLY